LDKTLDKNGKWTGDYLFIPNEELAALKIGIDKISLDGTAMAYWIFS